MYHFVLVKVLVKWILRLTVTDSIKDCCNKNYVHETRILMQKHKLPLHSGQVSITYYIS